ncbi:MAG: aldehyde dehydrogenase family protein [Thermoleophilaceae bacterium]
MTRLTYQNLYSDAPDMSDLDDAFEAALGEARATGFEPCPHLVGGEPVRDGDVIEREDPSRCDATAGASFAADRATVDRAVRSARAAAPQWAALSMQERAGLLEPAVGAVEERRFELAALASLETGKSRSEALAEVEEIAELVRIYCDAARDPGKFEAELAEPSGSVRVRSFLRPYGVFGVIAPFNYPFALASNMALAALVTGNAVVVKPSHLTPRCATALAEILGGLDIPAGTFNLVHGGDEAGAALVEGDVDGIAFTGSAGVGLAILRRMQSGPFPRPVIAEMGGKNPTIVTASADLSMAASAIAKSAFGLSGQKCNCCSRVLADAAIHDELLELVGVEAGRMQIGDPVERGSAAGPVIDAGAIERFESSVAQVREAGGTVVAGGERASDRGYFALPTVVSGLPAGHRLTREELFVPFLTVVRTAGLGEALAEANAVPFGLTAGIFSGDDGEVAEFLDRVEAGCTLVNHAAGATTGLWPGSHTFGGWKASGTTGKHAFGAFYLQQYMRQQCQTLG